MFRLILPLAFLSSFLSCEPIPDPSPPATSALVMDIQKHFVPDRRVARLDVDVLVREDHSLLLEGETTMPGAKDSLIRALENQGYDVIIDEVLEMPAEALGEKTFALARHSVVNLRSEKGHSQELATQVLLGTPLQVLKQDEEWYFVRCPDEYLAWVHGGEIVRMSADELQTWQEEDRVV